jgi:hypothetical protein
MTALGDCVTHLILADEISLTAIFPDPNAVTAQARRSAPGSHKPPGS